jgi:hypothetical protein
VDKYKERFAQKKAKHDALVKKVLPFLKIMHKSYPHLLTEDEGVNVENLVFLWKLALKCSNYQDCCIALDDYKKQFNFDDQFGAELFKYVYANK